MNEATILNIFEQQRNVVHPEQRKRTGTVPLYLCMHGLGFSLHIPLLLFLHPSLESEKTEL